MKAFLLCLPFLALFGLFAVTPSPACPITTGVPASTYATSYSTCAAQTYTTVAAAPVYYAYPLAVLAVPTVAAPAVVPPAAPVAPAPAVAPAPQPEAAVPAPAPVTVTLAAPVPIIQRSFYANYGVPQAAFVPNSYAYGAAALSTVGYGGVNAVIVNRARTFRTARAPVIVQRQRIGPVRNFIARRRASRTVAVGVPASTTVIIRR